MQHLGQDETFLAKRDLYLAAIEGSLVKIGVSRKPKRRVTGISTTQPHKAELIKIWPKAGRLEPTVHHVFKPLRHRGEWFKCGTDFAQWVCEMVVSQKQDTARHAVTLYKQLKDSEARWERLAGVAKERADERAALWSAITSLEDDLHAAGFDTEGYQIRMAVARERQQRDARRRDPWGEYIDAASNHDLRPLRTPWISQEEKHKRQVAALAQEQERRQKAIAALAPRHITALRAVVTSSGFDEIDAFTFDVLGRMGLLTRPKGSKVKADWQLTDEGRAVLEQHNQL
jgi:Meiotically up-regulated gene 113